MKRLDDKGRCCGIKPIVYKRYKILFCHRCDAQYELSTKMQVENFKWKYCDNCSEINETCGYANRDTRDCLKCGGTLPKDSRDGGV